jgi:hypothetical protein
MSQDVDVKVGEARAEAVQWVRKYGQREEDFGGAFFGGAGAPFNDNADLPARTALDLVVVVDREGLTNLGTFDYHGVLLDVAYVSWSQLGSPEQVLSSYHLAGSLRTDTVVEDPTGRLRPIQRGVSRGFSRMEWVRRRCQHARRRVEDRLRSVGSTPTLHDQVISWLLGHAISTHMLLVADLRHPTAADTYLAAREVLFDYEQADQFTEMLRLLGCIHLTRRRVQIHHRALELAFDAAVKAARSPYFIGTEISPVTRPLVVDSAADLIAQGFHREAMFSIVSALARCQAVLAADASRATRAEFVPAFEAALADLGVATADDLPPRAEEMLRFLPQLWWSTEKVLAANSAIRS